MKKGISIPINTLVMLAIAIVVLLAVVAWFMMTFFTGTENLTVQQAFSICCVAYTSTNCDTDPSSFTCSERGNFPEESLEDRAKRASIPTEKIKTACNCPTDYRV